ncbi:MAG TPA: hypothetical protein VG844_07880 [Terracidiphilus sp.]|nr:hypothetical protein [Terracidiphilus sp.]
MQHDPELDRIREEAEEKQRAILYPDTLRSGRSVDEFLWNGDPHPKPVQRVGLALFGMLFSGLAVLGIVLLFTQDNWPGRIFGIAMGLLAGIAGARLMGNAFRHIRRG